MLVWITKHKQRMFRFVHRLFYDNKFMVDIYWILCIPFIPFLLFCIVKYKSKKFYFMVYTLCTWNQIICITISYSVNSDWYSQLAYLIFQVFALFLWRLDQAPIMLHTLWVWRTIWRMGTTKHCDLNPSRMSTWWQGYSILTN